MKSKIQERILELATLSVVGIGLALGLSEHAEGHTELYYGDNHGGDVTNPPEGSVISQALTDKFGVPIAVDEGNNTYYGYVISHWFDPQQMAQFPSEVWMYGIAPYDHHSSDSSGTE